MKWISVKERLPSSEWTCKSFLISGHEWFGIGTWEKVKWTSAFLGEFPCDQGEYMEGHEAEKFLDSSIMYWAEIPDYPIRGRTKDDE